MERPVQPEPQGRPERVVLKVLRDHPAPQVRVGLLVLPVHRGQAVLKVLRDHPA